MEKNTAEGVKYSYFIGEFLFLLWDGIKKVTNWKDPKREDKNAQIIVICRLK